MNTTLPIDSNERKQIPLVAGLDGYFPAALVGVARHSWESNQKHNGDKPMHWSFDKSTDHAECVRRHLLDLHEIIAMLDRVEAGPDSCDHCEQLINAILDEANALAWRALALSQTLHMKYRGAPLPFNAKRG